MIIERDGEWFFNPLDNKPVNFFGPYSTREAAERCQENYRAFVSDAPVCHH